MDDATLLSMIPDPIPKWLTRAMDSSSPIHPEEGAVHTESFYNDDLGGEVLVPRVRLNEKGEPVVVDNPLGEALSRGDYILIKGPPGKETEKRATELSKFISDRLVRKPKKTGSMVEKPLYDRN